MSQAFTPGLQVKRSAVVRRIRELPLPGEILVKMGDKVQNGTKVAQASLPGELLILRIPEEMGIEDFEVMKNLRVKQGDTVQKGQLLCEHKGLFGLLRSQFVAPADGLIELITEKTGHVALRLASQPLSIDAYVSGEVVAVDPRKSVTIESRGTFVQGIFGIGGERQGTLMMLKVEPGKELGVDDIPADVHGRILIGGTKPSAEALQKASQGGAVGLVTGAIDDQAMVSYLGYDLGIALTGDEKVPMSLIVTEGFGKIPISRHTLELLAECDGMQASMSGATQVRAGALRPEIIVARDVPAESLHSGGDRGLCQGSSIRIIRVPYFGVYATVVELPHDAVKLDTGAFARVLKAKLADGTVVTVPRANVELV